MTFLPRKEFPLKSLPIAADMRLSRTNYVDDQSWDVRLGEFESPGIALQSRYGGRAGLASLAMMWDIDGRLVYQAQAYAEPAKIIAFAPGCAIIEAKITPTVELTMVYWVMGSQAVGAQVTLTNTGQTPINCRADVFAHVIIDQKEQKLAILSLSDGTQGLSLGNIGNLQPVVIMENAQAQSTSGKVSARIGSTMQLDPGESGSVRFTHGGMRTMSDSLKRAQFWLGQDWQSAFERIASAAERIPFIETGDPALDVNIHYSYHMLMQSFMRPASSLPHAHFVANRTSAYGYSLNGEGTDHPRNWGGQSVYLTYLVALAIANIEPELANGLLLNYLAVQEPDGSIDARPGPAGQRQGVTAPPLLGRILWKLFRYHEEAEIVEKSVPALKRFYDHWFHIDPDHLPVWASERQMGYGYFPMFGTGKPWAQNADITRVESPDMASYLLLEGICLKDLTRIAGDHEASDMLRHHTEKSRITLEDLWRDDRYRYRDCYLHRVTPPQMLLQNVPADEDHYISNMLERPARLQLRIEGGTHKVPNLMIRIDGLDLEGKPITETVKQPKFGWYRGYGAYTTWYIFSQVDRIVIEGLSRVYRLTAYALDTTYIDINGLIPICSMGITYNRAERLMQQITEEETFWRPNGVPMTSAKDEHYDPSNQNGAGGVWAFWQTMLIDGLWDYGFAETAHELLHRFLKVQTEVLHNDGRLYEFYNSEIAQGHGQTHHLSGVAPLHALIRTMGTRIQSPVSLWTGGQCAWDRPYTLKQHGVTVIRSPESIHIEFPSGHVIDLPGDAEWQRVFDPTVKVEHQADVMLQGTSMPPLPEEEEAVNNKVLIQVEIDEE